MQTNALSDKLQKSCAASWVRKEGNGKRGTSINEARNPKNKSNVGFLPPGCSVPYLDYASFLASLKDYLPFQMSEIKSDQSPSPQNTNQLLKGRDRKLSFPLLPPIVQYDSQTITCVYKPDCTLDPSCTRSVASMNQCKNSPIVIW